MESYRQTDWLAFLIEYENLKSPGNNFPGFIFLVNSSLNLYILLMILKINERVNTYFRTIYSLKGGKQP